MEDILPIGAGISQDSSIVQKRYDAWADRYEQDTDDKDQYTVPTTIGKVLEKLYDSVNTSSIHVLDAGCGTGLFAPILKELGFTHITGIDLSPNMLDIAKRKSIYTELFPMDFSQPLPLTSTYHLIVCLGVTACLTPNMPFLSEFDRLLASQGYLILTFRDDFFESGAWQQALESFTQWELLEQRTSLPYLPGNPEYTDKITYRYLVFRKQ